MINKVDIHDSCCDVPTFQEVNAVHPQRSLAWMGTCHWYTRPKVEGKGEWRPLGLSHLVGSDGSGCVIMLNQMVDDGVQVCSQQLASTRSLEAGVRSLEGWA